MDRQKQEEMRSMLKKATHGYYLQVACIILMIMAVVAAMVLYVFSLVTRNDGYSWGFLSCGLFVVGLAYVISMDTAKIDLILESLEKRRLIQWMKKVKLLSLKGFFIWLWAVSWAAMGIWLLVRFL